MLQICYSSGPKPYRISLALIIPSPELRGDLAGTVTHLGHDWGFAKSEFYPRAVLDLLLDKAFG